MRRPIPLPTAALTAALAAMLAGVLAVMPCAPAANAAPPSLDGMSLGHLPDGLGTSSDFAYEFDEVGFVSRDWESRAGEGWRVDLSVDVMRGEPMRSAQGMHDWVIAYEKRPTADAHYRRTTVRGHPAWRSADEVFWRIRPGVAVVVRLDTARWSQQELSRTARAVTVAHGG